MSVFPCEFHDRNAHLLRSLVVDLAAEWGLPTTFITWLKRECRWVNTLVDRIVTGRPADHPLLDTDPLLVAAEPYAQWIVEGQDVDLFNHPSIRLVDDVAPYMLRKVRILNGAHTAIVEKARGTDLQTVRQAILDPQLSTWIRRLLLEEILPTIEDRIEDGSAFVATTFERFANPYVEHRLGDIALHHEAKLKARLEPTRREYIAKYGKEPELLSRLLG